MACDTGLMIESSYMKVGKGPGGVIGSTTQSPAMQIRAKSLHAQNMYIDSVDLYSQLEKADLLHHKQENKGRIRSDQIEYTFVPANNPANTRHGGVGLFYKNSLPVIVRNDLSFNESIVVELKFGQKK